MPRYLILLGLDHDKDEVFYIFDTEQKEFVELFFDRDLAIEFLKKHGWR